MEKEHFSESLKNLNMTEEVRQRAMGPPGAPPRAPPLRGPKWAWRRRTRPAVQKLLRSHAAIGAPDLTPAVATQEVGKFEKAFKDPKFMEMFAEYAKEISDPKVRWGIARQRGGLPWSLGSAGVWGRS